MASTSDVIARVLTLAPAAVPDAVPAAVAPVSTQLQLRHSCASSAFSVPHFGQYICSLLSV
jgi:hypothetical protein